MYLSRFLGCAIVADGPMGQCMRKLPPFTGARSTYMLGGARTDSKQQWVWQWPYSCKQRSLRGAKCPHEGTCRGWQQLVQPNSNGWDTLICWKWDNAVVPNQSLLAACAVRPNSSQTVPVRTCSVKKAFQTRSADAHRAFIKLLLVV